MAASVIVERGLPRHENSLARILFGARRIEGLVAAGAGPPYAGTGIAGGRIAGERAPKVP